ncbi:MAG: calcium-translocating P-type ATPase, PMCA-type [Firmicutes bacterium]|nr:calcium-translocating P-type ATPase, PMCA-type [Bacillota bacterium]
MINYNGLNDEEVIINRKKYGTNELTKIKQKTFFKILLESLGDPIIKILLIALGIKILFIFSKYDWYETIGIAIAVMLASFISTISEYGSEAAFKRLQTEAAKIKVKVLRNNTLKEIIINDIVVGDIVKLSTGDSIPADGILISGSLSCNEASLTGESKDIKKNDKDNKLFRGTVITNGYGKMLVKKVGNETEYGKISLEIQESDPTSPLKTRLYGLAKIVSKIGYIGALVVSLSYLFNKIVIANNFDLDLIITTITTPKIIINHLIYALTLSVTIIIVAVPEGLPMMITLVLSSNMKRMLKDNVLVRKPTGIETSGNLNYLLTDKTGTLTKGELEVTSFVSGDLKIYKNEAEIKKTKLHDILYKSIILNNESTISNNKIIGGNATDKALICFFKFKENNIKITKRIPFDSENKFSAVYLADDIYVKGASEVIINKCHKYLNSLGEEKYILNKNLFLREIEKNTKRGIRVIALAKGESLDNLTFVGFITLKDELRREAKDGINLIRNAGINVIMITGDAKDTAKNIAADCGIITNPSDLILTSDEFNRMSNENIKKICHKLKVVARALPQDKSRLVTILKEMNQIVGMTGDGVNDAPALKKANVGFSMGSGTEVAKEASDIVILDNNILSISKAILYGRTIFKSIRKFVIYQLTVNMTALFLSIVGSYIGVSTPITIIQMLWLNMIMDTFAGLAFSYEAPLKYYMEHKPKKIDEPIINKYMYSEILFTGLYSALLCILFLKVPIFKEIIRSDYKHFMTAYFALFIFIGIFNAFNARTERLNIFSNILKNKVFLIVFSFIIIAQIFLIYNGHDLFRTYGLSIFELFFVIILAFTVIPIDFIRKIILKKKGVKLEI